MSKSKAPLDRAKRIAERLIELLGPSCERIEVAGSIRRGVNSIGDIELVAIPKMVKAAERVSLYEERESEVSSLDIALAGLVRTDKLKQIVNGDKLKRYQIKSTRPPVQLDLFITNPSAWGYQFAIRTGPSSFSKHVVTQIFKGGALHNDFRCKDGFVWRAVNSFDEGDEMPSDQFATFDDLRWVMVPMPEEEDFFHLLTTGYVEPAYRRYH